MMRGLLFVVVLITAISAAACTQEPGPIASTQAALPTQRGPASSASGVVASAVVVPALHSKLSFLISGPVLKILVAAGDQVEAGQTLMVLDSPELQFGVAQAEAATRAAEFEYQYWIPARLDRPPERRQLAEQELVKARTALELARAESTQATLTAPFAGTVVSLDAAPGELVQPGRAVITLASLDHLQIKTTDLSERDLPAVQVGQPASISVSAVGMEFPGRVVAIAPVADRLGGDVVFQVTLEFDTSPADLLWGMSAEVEIHTEP